MRLPSLPLEGGLAAVALSVALATAPLPQAALAVPPTLTTQAALPGVLLADTKSDAAESKALADAIAKAKKEVSSKEKEIKKGAIAKLPVASAKPTDLSVALRGSTIKINPRDLKSTTLPQSVGVTLPVLGPVRIDLNIAVSKVTAQEVAESDIVIALPADLVKAGKLAAGGNVGAAIDAPGLASGRFEAELSTPRKGEAGVTVTSPLIPQLPLQKTKGLGRFCFECGDGNAPSDWFVARNLGNGVQFYGNAKTGKSQFDVPKGF